MLSLVPIASFILLFFVFQKVQAVSCWRSSFLSAALVWGLLLTGITEFLNLFRLLSFGAILGSWILIAALTVAFLLRVNGPAKRLDIRLWLADISKLDLFLLTSIAIIVVVVGMIGLISPPNNWDSMTYHMSRVVHWIQDKSVAHYPTSFLPQLYEGPWAEFAVMHFQILAGGDRFANLIQWFGLLGSVVGVSLLAGKLGANLRGQIFAAVFCATIPMGIVQGSSTQTDYVVSLWLVCALYFALLLKDDDQIRYSLAAGAALGLGILTKPTAYFYAFPFVAWVSLWLLKSRRARGFLQIVLIVVIAFVINVGHYARNYNLFGSPLGPGYEEPGKKYSNDIFTIPALTSNVIRNLALHVSTPFRPVNTFFEKAVNKAHRMIGFDINDPRTTWPEEKFDVEPISLQEDYASNPLHLLLIGIFVPVLVLQQYKKQDTIYYLICLILGFLMFCSYIKWQPWNSRLHLPFFVLWSPLIGLSLSEIKARWIAYVSLVLLLLGAIPYLLLNDARSFWGEEDILTLSRTELYFNNRETSLEPYIRSAQFLADAGCADVGLMLETDSYEYPFWVLLPQTEGQAVRIEHVNVTNISGVLYKESPFNTFNPCAVIVVNENLPDEVRVGEVPYLQKWFSEAVGVYLKE
jgi:4-amino-4-deoxy-L-arabinose transferase-like glycosyltransferase